MAIKTYLYQPTGVENINLDPLVAIGASPAVLGASSILILPVQIDETSKQDLDDAMAHFGYEFVAEQTTDPPPGPSTNYGTQPDEPTEPAPSEGDIYYNTTNQAWYFYDGDTMTWKPYGSNAGAGSGSLVVTLSSQAAAWVTTNADTYTTMSKFRFAGTDKLGVAIKIFVNIWKASPGGGTVSCQIFDATNGNPIAATTGISTQDENNLVDLGVLSALPTGPAVFEIQGRRDSGGPATTCAISTVNVEF
jgi:hypothetical protein